MAGLFAALFGGGAPSGNNGAAAGSGRKQPCFSLAHLQELYDKLSAFRQSDLEKERGGEQVVETVREITEALVWGEKNDTSFFDFFCEKSILADFIRVLSLSRAPKTVKVQLLQTLSMLVQNIRREQSLFYLLSNNEVNRLILMPLDFTDEEILAYWITLLKSLAMRLDDATINFFFMSHIPSFPLYIEATKFFNHRDQMVRATVRTITLRVYAIGFDPMRAFVQRHAEESYFSQLALHLKGIWQRLNEAAETEDLGALQHENDLQQDLLIYLSDVFELGISQLNEVLAERLLDCVMIPLLVLSLDPNSNSSLAHLGDRSQKSQRLAPRVALFLLRQVLEIIRCPQLAQPLAAAVFHAKVPERLRCVMPQDAPTEFHSHFVRFLRGRDDACFMHAAGAVHCCMRNRPALPVDFLEAARMCPPASASSGARRQPPLVSERHLDVLWFLLSGLQRHTEWRPETLQILVLVILDLFLDPAISSSEECRDAALHMAQDALIAAALHLRGLLEAQLQGRAADDGLLDEFVQEWEARRAPSQGISEMCANAWRLLLPSAGAARARGLADLSTEGARRAVCSFFLLRRLLSELVEHAQAAKQLQVTTSSGIVRSPQPPASSHRWGGSSASGGGGGGGAGGGGGGGEPSPVQVDPEMLGSFREGMEFQTGNAECIACSVMAADGCHTRHLLLHDAWLLLVRPDLSVPGSAVVTTLWPVQQVQTLIDRGDPRILRLGMQAAFGSRRPGEALEYSQPASASDAVVGQRRGSCFTLALIFEDVRRCHAADRHLQTRRREVRHQLLGKVLSFVEECRAQATPPQVAGGL